MDATENVRIALEKAEMRVKALNGEFSCQDCGQQTKTSDPDEIKSQLCRGCLSAVRLQKQYESEPAERPAQYIIEETSEERYERIRKEQGQGMAKGAAFNQAVYAAIGRTTRKTSDKNFIEKVKQYYQEFKKINL